MFRRGVEIQNGFEAGILLIIIIILINILFLALTDFGNKFQCKHDGGCFNCLSNIPCAFYHFANFQCGIQNGNSSKPRPPFFNRFNNEDSVNPCVPVKLVETLNEDQIAKLKKGTILNIIIIIISI